MQPSDSQGPGYVPPQVLDAARACVQKAQQHLVELQRLQDEQQRRRSEMTKPNHLLQGLDPFVRRLQTNSSMLEKLLSQALQHEEGMSCTIPLMPATRDLTTRVGEDLALWDVLKHSRSVVHFGKSFSGRTREQRQQAATLAGIPRNELKAAMSDMQNQDSPKVAVVYGGAEWIYLGCILEHRFVQQMTEAGWDWGQYQLGDEVPESDWNDHPFAKRLKWLYEAAKLNRHEFVVPRLRLCLPNIARTHVDVAVFFDQLCRLEPRIEVIVEDRSSILFREPTSPQYVDNLLRNSVVQLSPTLVLCYTALVTLISDITHQRLQPQPWQHGQTVFQIRNEIRHGGLAVKRLYPVLRGRKLVITKQTVAALQKLLETVGTESEVQRARLLVPSLLPAFPTISDGDIRQRFIDLSVYEVPGDLQLPLDVLEEEWDSSLIAEKVQATRLPPFASIIGTDFGPLSTNPSYLSTYMHAWFTGSVVITSNMDVKRRLGTFIRENRPLSDDLVSGPKVRIVEAANNMLSADIAPPPSVHRNEDGTLDRDAMREWRRSRASKVRADSDA